MTFSQIILNLHQSLEQQSLVDFLNLLLRPNDFAKEPQVQSESLSARICLWKRNNTHKEHKASLISYTPVHTATCENREKNETHSMTGQVKYAKKEQTPTEAG